MHACERVAVVVCYVCAIMPYASYTVSTPTQRRPPASRQQPGARTPDLHTAWSRTLLYLHASQARTLCSQMIICLRWLLPSLGSPCPLPRPGTGDGETRRDSALRTSVPIALRKGPRRVHAFLLARPQNRQADSRVSHLHNHRLQGTSLTAFCCSLLPPDLFVPRACRQLLDLVASVIKLTCRLHQSLVCCACLPFFDSFPTIKIRGTDGGVLCLVMILTSSLHILGFLPCIVLT